MKNFCYAKLMGPFGFSLAPFAFGRGQCGFRITRRAEGTGREQTEAIISNSKLQERVVEAAVRFIERKGFEFFEASWAPEGTTIDLIANDEDALAFIDVIATEYGEGGFEGGKVP